jgi:peptidoglycan hydrolase-like protein with peptidoglycan-binding domain
VDTIPREFVEGNTIPFGGVVLRIGAESEDVRILQQYLNGVAASFPTVPTVSVTGYFGTRTREAVIAFQELADIPASGTVGAVTWEALTDVYGDLYNGAILGEGQFPGFTIGG